MVAVTTLYNNRLMNPMNIQDITVGAAERGADEQYRDDTGVEGLHDQQYQRPDSKPLKLVALVALIFFEVAG